MAGAGVLGPTALQTLVALYCADDGDSDDEDDIITDMDTDGTAPPLADEHDINECNLDDDGGCIISIEDELGLGSFDLTTPSSTLMSDSVGNLRLIDESIDTKAMVNNFVAASLPEGGGKTFEEVDLYDRARVNFPAMTLDQVRIETVDGVPVESSLETLRPSTARECTIQPQPLKFVLGVTVAGSHRLDIPLYSETTSLEKRHDLLPSNVRREIDASSTILRDMSPSYNPDGSAAFMALALALRYKVPITVDSSVLDMLVQQSRDGGRSTSSETVSSIVTTPTDYNAAIARHLPQWKSLTDLQSQSQRVSRNIQQSHEVHKLQGALRIATEKGDVKAAEKIRAALDELDGFDELPTTEREDTDRSDDDNEK
mmetsp:Transcript_36610/g.80087  ORF Transcript_36610/g.80087 Transcript_36610/m.80087 type:complete len:372 (+) Transcript_36610:3-1118(+)